MSLSDYMSYRKSIHPFGYLMFRYGPVFAVCLFVAVSLDRGDRPVWPATIVMLVLHVWITHGRAIKTVWPNRSDPRRSPLVALHALAGLSIVVVGVAAALMRDRLAALIPPLNALAGELWGAAIAGAFVAYLFTHVSTRQVDGFALISDVRSRIAPELVALARREAVSHGADPDLVEAILVTEELQRPTWFRQLERLKSLVFREGTYGIMQVRHRGWIGDEESIRLAVADRLAGQQIPVQTYGRPGELGHAEYVDTESLRLQLSSYNRSDVWLDTVVEVLQLVRNR
jgi:hypothetical protein